MAREYRRRGIPLDAIVIDYFHWTEQGDWKFDPAYWPDPEGMCQELKELGVEPVVSIWPTINPQSENWQEMYEGNMLVSNENGQYGMFDFYGQQTFIDPTNPETRRFVNGSQTISPGTLALLNPPAGTTNCGASGHGTTPFSRG